MQGQADVVIVGGGLAGLSCAVGLQGLGLRVLVLEKSQRLGGRAGSWTDAATGDAVDLGPHVLLSEYRNMLELLGRLGTRERVVWQTQPLLTLAQPGGRAVEMRASARTPPLHLLANLRPALACVSRRDLASNRRAAWQALRREEPELLALDGLDALGWLRGQGVSERFIDWFWGTACLSLLAAPPQHCSAAAALRVLRQMTVRSGYHFGFPRTALADLFADAARERIEAGGGRVLLGAAVERVELRRSAFAALRLADGGRIEARCCVCALPPAELLEVVPPGSWPGLGAAARFRPSRYISTYLWFDRSLGPESFWARPWSSGGLVCDSYDLSNIRSGCAGRPSLVASNIIDAERFGPLDDEEVLRRTLEELAEFRPAVRQARLRHALVNRVPMAIPRASPGTERLRPATRTPVPGLLLAGDWTRTGLPASMESAVRSGWLAAEEAAAVFGHALRLAQPVPEAAGLARWISRPRRRDPAAAR